MKVLFVTGLYSLEHIESIRELSYGNIQNAANTFQLAIVDGLQKNNVDFDVVSLPFLPAYPMRYKKLFSIDGTIKSGGTIVGEMLSYCNLAVYKTFSIRKKLYLYINDWLLKNYGTDDKIIILTYTPYPPFLKAIKKLKKRFPNIVISSIVTDLVDDMMNYNSNRSLLKRIQCCIEKYETKHLYPYIDKYILLSGHMVEKIPVSKNKNIVVEGISVEKDLPVSDSSGREKFILYTGTLASFSGIRELIDAFHKINDKEIKLVICGSGDLQIDVIRASQSDQRIIYKGLLPRDEAVQLQNQAKVLINPRRPDGEITRYSFPSKTMEYLASGTPMIGYRLEGIPEEYYSYYYTVNDMSEDSLTSCIEEVIALSDDVLKKKAVDAYEFIMNNKTSKIQVKKIIDFLLK